MERYWFFSHAFLGYDISENERIFGTDMIYVFFFFENVFGLSSINI